MMNDEDDEGKDVDNNNMGAHHHILCQGTHLEGGGLAEEQREQRRCGLQSINRLMASVNCPP